MTKEERTILQTVNAALEEHGRHERFAPHRFFPMHRVLVCELPEARIIRIWTARRSRELDVFIERPQRDGWGRTEHIGEYQGTGWLPALVLAAVGTVTSPPAPDR